MYRAVKGQKQWILSWFCFLLLQLAWLLSCIWWRCECMLVGAMCVCVRMFYKPHLSKVCSGLDLALTELQLSRLGVGSWYWFIGNLIATCVCACGWQICLASMHTAARHGNSLQCLLPCISFACICVWFIKKVNVRTKVKRAVQLQVAVYTSCCLYSAVKYRK